MKGERNSVSISTIKNLLLPKINAIKEEENNEIK